MEKLEPERSELVGSSNLGIRTEKENRLVQFCIVEKLRLMYT